MSKIKNLLATIMIVSLPVAAMFHIVEIWTENELAYKFKWTAMTLFVTALVMGLLIQAGEREADKTS